MTSKKLMRVIIALMEAIKLNDLDKAPAYSAIYDEECDTYTGSFDKNAVNQLVQMGVALLCNDSRGFEGLRLIARDDFLVSFAAGALEASRGNGLDYSDYASSSFAFTCGHQHYTTRKKSGAFAYNSDNYYMCHGFTDEATGEVYKQ